MNRINYFCGIASEYHVNPRSTTITVSAQLCEINLNRIFLNFVYLQDTLIILGK